MNDSLQKAVEAAAQAPAAPTRQVPIAPVPTSWNISQAQGPEGIFIILEVQTPLGHSVYFLDPATGNQIGDVLTQISSAAKSGLLLPK